MARYIDADAATERARLTYCKECNSYNGIKCRACPFDDALSCIDDFPTADVAPRAEVELWKGRTEAVFGAIPETKREFAMEIFAEIDTMIFGTIIPDDCAIISIAKLAELKKKYTEQKEMKNETQSDWTKTAGLTWPS